MSRSPWGVRLICTRSVASRNSAGMRTAWLLPFINTRLGSVSMARPEACVHASVDANDQGKADPEGP